MDEPVDILVRNFGAVCAGLYIGEHIKTKTQLMIFAPSAILLLVSATLRFFRARARYFKSIAKLSELLEKGDFEKVDANEKQ